MLLELGEARWNKAGSCMLVRFRTPTNLKLFSRYGKISSLEEWIDEASMSWARSWSWLVAAVLLNVRIYGECQLGVRGSLGPSLFLARMAARIILSQSWERPSVWVSEWWSGSFRLKSIWLPRIGFRIAVRPSVAAAWSQAKQDTENTFAKILLRQAAT